MRRRVEDAADHGQQGRLHRPGRPRPTRKTRSNRSAASSTGPRSPARAPRAGRRAAPARRGRGRPWCRSSGAPAPGRRRRRRRPRGSSYPRSPWRRRPRGPRRGSPPGCPGRRVGGRGTGASCEAGYDASARRHGEVLAGEVQRLAQVALALLPRRAPAGVDLEHDVAGEAAVGQVAQERRSAPIAPRPGTRCSSLAEPLPSVRWMWRSRSPSRSAIAIGSERAIAACERSMVVLA